MKKLLIAFVFVSSLMFAQTPDPIPEIVVNALATYGSKEFITSVEKIEVDEEEFYWEVYFEKGKKSYIFEIDQKGNIISKEDISE